MQIVAGVDFSGYLFPFAAITWILTARNNRAYSQYVEQRVGLNNIDMPTDNNMKLLYMVSGSIESRQPGPIYNIAFVWILLPSSDLFHWKISAYEQTPVEPVLVNSTNYITN
jgi:hypothetical protein